MSSPERTLHIVDDDPAVLESLALFARTEGLLPLTYLSAEEFLQRYRRADAECLLLDLRLPGMSGLELQGELQRRGIGIPVVLLSGHGDIAAAVQAVRSGALDFVEKPYQPQHLIDCLAACFAADRERRQRESAEAATRARLEQLSAREREVLERLVEGHSSKEIAKELGISPRTVEIHRARIRAKLDAHSTTDLVRLALRARGEDADPSG